MFYGSQVPPTSRTRDPVADAAGAGATMADVASMAGGRGLGLNPGMATHNLFTNRAKALMDAGDSAAAMRMMRTGNRVIGVARGLRAAAPALGVIGATALAVPQGLEQAGGFGAATQALGQGGGAWAGMAGGAALGSAFGPVGTLVGGALGGLGGAMGGGALASGVNQGVVNSIESGGALGFLDPLVTTPTERAFNAQQRQLEMQRNSPAMIALKNEESRRKAEMASEVYRQIALQYMAV